MKRSSNFLMLIFLIYTSSAVFVGCGPKRKQTGPSPQQIANDTACTPQTITNDYGQNLDVCVGTVDTTTSDPFENSPKIFVARVTPNTQAFRDFIKEALGVCDRQSGQLLGIDFGAHDCNAYMAGVTDFTIYTPTPNSNTATVTVASYYRQTGLFNFNASIGLTLAPWAYQNPMGLPSLSVAPVNDSNGFEVYGPATNPAYQAYSLAWSKTLRIRIENGKFTDSILTADIYYGNELMAENVPFQLQNVGF